MWKRLEELFVATTQNGAFAATGMDERYCRTFDRPWNVLDAILAKYLSGYQAKAIASNGREKINRHTKLRARKTSNDRIASHAESVVVCDSFLIPHRHNVREERDVEVRAPNEERRCRLSFHSISLVSSVKDLPNENMPLSGHACYANQKTRVFFRCCKTPVSRISHPDTVYSKNPAHAEERPKA
jgi:hypothetical protein